GVGRRRHLRQPRRPRLGRLRHQRPLTRLRHRGEGRGRTRVDPVRPPSGRAQRARRGGLLPRLLDVYDRRLRPRRRRPRARQVLMRVFAIGEDAALEAELAERGLDLVRSGDAKALVTLAPRVELRPAAELEPDEWRASFAAWVEEPFFAAQPWLRPGRTWVA